jgi:hypothetical protein
VKEAKQFIAWASTTISVLRQRRPLALADRSTHRDGHRHGHSLVHEASDEAIHAELWEAVHAGLVLRTDGTYAFLHDRVREAVMR